MKPVDASCSWQGEQQTKTEGTWFKKKLQDHFPGGAEEHLQWNDDILSGTGIQILEGQSSGGKENQAPGK